ncbi:MAG TPA: hypothetical protein VHM70_16340 [Polyangiaceae bacterium]|nr:hypothetical protein [Polyangiaceae bacterium]
MDRSRRRPPESTLGVTDCDPCGDRALRCGCGCLLARFVNGHVELKCRRCKRTVTIAVAGLEAATLNESGADVR